ncbi:tryptophanase [Cutibacterium acnes JCM 18918]|nr:tryptophanase [Cutibacterium acnes JCM 18918]
MDVVAEAVTKIAREPEKKYPDTALHGSLRSCAISQVDSNQFGDEMSTRLGGSSPAAGCPAVPSRFGAAGSGAPSGTEQEQGLQRGLKNRHIQFIALGGAIGTGLFYGAAESIEQAGPAIMVCYLIGGAVIFLIMRALGEMSVEHPTSGAFSYYAYRNWSPRAGFVSGYNYWFNYIAVSMAELTVVGKYVNFWFPQIPEWLSAGAFLVLITIINLTAVRAYGEFEFWFAVIKVVAILAMIVLGVLIIATGLGGGPPTGIGNLWRHGGFFPTGISGMLCGFVVVMFSFGGVELIGITAGEADDPRRSIPRAINQVVYRILIFYIGAISVMLCLFSMEPDRQGRQPLRDDLRQNRSRRCGEYPQCCGAYRFHVGLQLGLYSNGRMLYSLAAQHNAPGIFWKTNRLGAPWVGVLASSVVTATAVLLTYLIPGKVFFLYIISIALISGVINWTMIIITNLKFRRRIGPEGVAALEFRMPGNPVTSYVVLVFLALVVVIMAMMPSYRVALVVGPVWLALLWVGYDVSCLVRRRHA